MTQGKPWTAEDTERLRLHISQGGSVARAAVIFRRTAPSMRTCARQLGLSFPTISQLRERLMGPPPVGTNNQPRQPASLTFRQRQALESSPGEE